MVAVVAGDRYLADDAAELVEVVYEPLSAVEYSKDRFCTSSAYRPPRGARTRSCSSRSRWCSDLLLDQFDAAVAGRLSKSVAGSSNITLTTTEARNQILEFTGTLTGNINVVNREHFAQMRDGAILANSLCLPIADKLASKSREETVLKEIIIQGVMAIQCGDSPRVVEQKLKVFLPPLLRA